ELLRVAQTMLDRGNEARALELCRQAASAAKSDPKLADTGLQAYMKMGKIFRDRKWFSEAALAFDAGADRFPTAGDAAEGVYQALQTYLGLNNDEKKPFYKRRVDER